MVRLTSAIARSLLDVAIALLVLALVLVAAAAWIGSLPVRRVRRSSPGRAQLEAAQLLFVALAGLVSAIRSPAREGTPEGRRRPATGSTSGERQD